jgi:ABC-2 type transport system ATP-binding protein
MELMELSDQRENLVDTLSRGMKQRLGLARSLVHDPHVLLLDEPAAGLDPEARLELRDVLRELSRLGKTIVISSHILSELAELCTHVGIIQEGRMVREGSLAALQDTVSARDRLSIHLLRQDQMAEALDFLVRHTACEHADVEGPRSIHAEIDSGEAARSAILTGMVEAGIAVTGFATPDSLEAVFQRVTRRDGASA